VVTTQVEVVDVRITQRDLEGMLTNLNAISKREYVLDYAYGAVRLYARSKAGKGALVEVSLRVSKREMYYILSTLVEYRLLECRAEA